MRWPRPGPVSRPLAPGALPLHRRIRAWVAGVVPERVLHPSQATPVRVRTKLGYASAVASRGQYSIQPVGSCQQLEAGVARRMRMRPACGQCRPAPGPCDSKSDLRLGTVTAGGPGPARPAAASHRRPRSPDAPTARGPPANRCRRPGRPSPGPGGRASSETN